MLLTRRQSAMLGGYALVGAALLSSAPAVADAADEAAVEKAAQDLRKAMLDADGAALDALVAPEMVYAHSDGHVEGKTQYIDTIVDQEDDLLVDHPVQRQDGGRRRHGGDALRLRLRLHRRRASRPPPRISA